MKSRKRYYYATLLFVLLVTTVKLLAPSGLRYAAPTLIPHTTRDMKCAGFWISLHPNPDGVVLNGDEIAALNKRTVEELSLRKDVLKIKPNYPGEDFKDTLNKNIEPFLKKPFYNVKGKKVDKLFYQNIAKNMGIEDIPAGITVRYGFLSRYADQRVLPTGEVITEEPLDIDFDVIQNNSLDIGTPLAVYCESADKAWYYCVTPESSGWIKKDSVVICTYDQMAGYLKKDFCVVTAAKAEIYLDSSLTKYYDYARMGSTFAVASMNDDVFEITIPSHDEQQGFYERPAYLKRSDAHSGFLAYTPRTIIEQAFKLLNAPYGWGGMYGEQDCSSFLKEIFATTGVMLPRNSADQAKIGTKIAEFKEKKDNELKLSILEKEGVGGIDLLQLNGHIVLYLGQFNGRFYVIHETSGYRDRVWWHDRVRTLRRVVVSDLLLGDGSKKGSLLERILVITKVVS